MDEYSKNTIPTIKNLLVRLNNTTDNFCSLTSHAAQSENEDKSGEWKEKEKLI